MFFQLNVFDGNPHPPQAGVFFLPLGFVCFVVVSDLFLFVVSVLVVVVSALFVLLFPVCALLFVWLINHAHAIMEVDSPFFPSSSFFFWRGGSQVPQQGTLSEHERGFFGEAGLPFG